MEVRGAVLVGEGAAVEDDVEDEAVGAVDQGGCFGVEGFVGKEDGEAAAAPDGAFAGGGVGGGEDVGEDLGAELGGEGEETAFLGGVGSRFRGRVGGNRGVPGGGGLGLGMWLLA